MRLFFDQNISHRILKLLPEAYAGSTTVKAEGLINSSDRDIWDFAKNGRYIIVTQDSDFNDLTSLLGFPPKIIWIRTGNIRTIDFAKILADYIEEIKKFEEDSKYGCLEILAIAK